MIGHAETWLDAYLDGELPPYQRRQAEVHLAQCQPCRDLLAERQALSTLLQEVPPLTDLKTESRFVAEVSLQLKRRSGKALPHLQALQLGWQLIPVALLMALAFIQTVVILSSGLGLFPKAEQALVGQATSVSSSLQLPALWGDLLEVIRMFSFLDWNWLTGLLALVAISLIYVAWLASWWARNRQLSVGSD